MGECGLKLQAKGGLLKRREMDEVQRWKRRCFTVGVSCATGRDSAFHVLSLRSLGAPKHKEDPAKSTQVQKQDPALLGPL
jgi:hypothetical protein